MSECCGSDSVKIIYSCSGAADVGELADRAVRALKKEGIAQGSCIAAIGAGLSGYVQSAMGADMTITVDGCSVACARKNMEKIGVNPVSVVLTELGYEKGKSPYSEKLFSSVVDDIRKILTSERKADLPESRSQGGCGCGGHC